MSATVTYYTGYRRTLLHVQEIDLKACALVILNQIIIPGMDLNPGPIRNLLKYTARTVLRHRDRPVLGSKRRTKVSLFDLELKS